ncbi:VRR-NUC domain-containing protein, partial [Micromonospora sp. NPDC049230]|uniref:VRR-NUC domain-containing protein n=1 Tax=Micromonospora sp. NPDC049230 TaxID=3155502 RepID=UPI0033E78555
MTTGEGPDNNWAEHDCGYVPLLTGGRLVKKHDPAWQLPELGNGRTNEALQRHVTHRAFHDRAHRQPGYGLGYHHSIHPRGELPGYPDVHAWAPKPGGQMFRELKGMGDFPRPEQVAVLTALAATGADVGVWWPCCWYSGRIDRELAALADAEPIGQHWAPGLPPQIGQTGYVPWTADQPAPAPGRVPAQRRPPGRPGRRDR